MVEARLEESYKPFGLEVKQRYMCRTSVQESDEQIAL
jgi:hypothetical protein